MKENFWLGSNMLKIIYSDGRHYVVESYEDYNVVFDGNYAQCRKYCETRYLEYMESIF